MSDFLQPFTSWINSHTDRIIFFAIAFVLAWLISRYTAKGMHAVLDRSPIPSTSLYINITRVTIWVLAAIVVLKPVFGIEANSLITALGVGGVAISLGLQATISNVVSGFGLMAGKVIKPGDRIAINGVRGTVKDVTWRHTVVTERGGNEMWIPNSVLNTATLEKLPRTNEALTTLPILLKSNINVRETVADIVETVKNATLNHAMRGTTPTVRLTSFTAYGIEANVILYAKDKTSFAIIQDATARALAGKPYMATAQDTPTTPTASTIALNNLGPSSDLADLVATRIMKPPVEIFADDEDEDSNEDEKD
ncbi:mechanosensitive ion channel family protein [Alloscardovia theropitheci]|uniref:Mechanosensitive ion channel family protein n=1 Tax=Alloscardovia theropitheci TaxID=2496842 RepID=A0A4R0R0S5_9BIFI|nr:mechanosensitive ion channel domain-containing protein [Alloscardovia theropitheci]TCD54676.1 mechanosensitive ion channel family protein [Alloscardovia theropitheci]